MLPTHMRRTAAGAAGSRHKQTPARIAPGVGFAGTAWRLGQAGTAGRAASLAR